MKTIQAFGVLVLVAITHCSPAPHYYDQYSTNLLSRSVRQAESTSTTQTDTKALLKEIQVLTIQVVKNYGCAFDPNSEEFQQTFLRAYARTIIGASPDEKLLESIKKIAASVVTSYGCAGAIDYNSQEFLDKYQAAYAVVVYGKTVSGSVDMREMTSLILKEYGCGPFNINDPNFVEKFLSGFTETLNAASKDDKGIDNARRHTARMASKLGCGNPDPESDDFKKVFYVGYAAYLLA